MSHSRLWVTASWDPEVVDNKCTHCHEKKKQMSATCAKHARTEEKNIYEESRPEPTHFLHFLDGQWLCTVHAVCDGGALARERGRAI